MISFKKGVAIDDSADIFFKGAQNLYKLGDVVLARMGRESTECQIIKNGKKDKQVVIFFGYKDIEEKFASALKLPRELTDSYISLAEQDLWDEPMRKRMENTLDEVENEWVKRSKEIRNFPLNILLIAESPYEKLSTMLFRDALPQARVTRQDCITVLASYSRNLL